MTSLIYNPITRLIELQAIADGEGLGAEFREYVGFFKFDSPLVDDLENASLIARDAALWLFCELTGEPKPESEMAALLIAAGATQ